MIIHFVCRGNAYRSRLAEAYLNSKKISHIRAISSGIEEGIHRKINGPITWLAERILQNNSLVPFMSLDSKQTSKLLLDKSNLVIFFNEKYAEFCKESYSFKNSSYEVWNILDVDDFGLTSDKQSREDEAKKIDISEKTFKEIKKRIDGLIKRLKI